MRLEIHSSEFKSDILRMFHNGLLKSFSIDYMYNAVMAWSEGVEYKVVEFDKYFRLDNRFNTYEMEVKSNKIIIDIVAK